MSSLHSTGDGTNAHTLYSSSFNYYLSQYYSTFWNNNFNMITVFNICEEVALSWNNFLFNVHLTTTWWWPTKEAETCRRNTENLLYSY